jgi:hypothetical protein
LRSLSAGDFLFRGAPKEVFRIRVVVFCSDAMARRALRPRQLKVLLILVEQALFKEVFFRLSREICLFTVRRPLWAAPI